MPATAPAATYSAARSSPAPDQRPGPHPGPAANRSAGLPDHAPATKRPAARNLPHLAARLAVPAALDSSQAVSHSAAHSSPHPTPQPAVPADPGSGPAASRLPGHRLAVSYSAARKLPHPASLSVHDFGPAASRPAGPDPPPPPVANCSADQLRHRPQAAACGGTVTVTLRPACGGRRGRVGCRRRGCLGMRTSPCRPRLPSVAGGPRVLLPHGAGAPPPVPRFRPPRCRTPGSCRSPPRPGSRGGDTKAPSPTP